MDIRVQGLTKQYGPQKAVDNIDFEVKTGEIVGFLGPNGAGKTTTMKIITCFMAANGGNVHIGDYNVKDHQDQIKSRIGYLPENNPLYHDMPVMEYLQFTAAIQGVSKSMIPERIAEMVRLCGLDVEKHKKIGELSKGFRQRVGLAQAMIHDPEILILDEPTTGLDPNQIVEIRKLIREVGREKTVILSTHILPEVEATCDRILIINNGKIVADGSADNLRKQAQGQELVKIQIEGPDNNTVATALQGLGSVNMVDPVAGDFLNYSIQSASNQSSRRDIFNMCVQNHWTLLEMTPIETRLEDIFRDLTLN